MTTAWRNRIVEHGEEDPTQLLANPDNWRMHPATQREALRGSLSELGWIDTVLVNRTTGHVVDGHARVEEAISKGEATVPVTYVELSEDEERLALATFDPITAMASADEDKLRVLLGSVTSEDDGLRALLASLAGDSAAFDELLGDTGYNSPGLGFLVAVEAPTPQDRDKAVDALRAVGMEPIVKTTRE